MIEADDELKERIATELRHKLARLIGKRATLDVRDAMRRIVEDFLASDIAPMPPRYVVAYVRQDGDSIACGIHRNFPAYPIDAAEYLEAFGVEPGPGDLHRINCGFAGDIGHLQCGYCADHGKARHLCGCLAGRGGS